LNYPVAPGLVVRLNFPAVNALEYFRWRQPDMAGVRAVQNWPRNLSAAADPKLRSIKIFIAVDCVGAPYARQSHFKP
jgi:hypothetical protein